MFKFISCLIFKTFVWLTLETIPTSRPLLRQRRDNTNEHTNKPCFLLNHANMGDDDFETTHSKLEKQQTQFRERLVLARNKLGVNQQEFANRLNINKTIVQEIESGRRKAEPGLIQKMQHRLNKILDA